MKPGKQLPVWTASSLRLMLSLKLQFLNSVDDEVSRHDLFLNPSLSNECLSLHHASMLG